MVHDDGDKVASAHVVEGIGQQVYLLVLEVVAPAFPQQQNAVGDVDDALAVGERVEAHASDRAVGDAEVDGQRQALFDLARQARQTPPSQYLRLPYR